MIQLSSVMLVTEMIFELPQSCIRLYGPHSWRHGWGKHSRNWDIYQYMRPGHVAMSSCLHPAGVRQRWWNLWPFSALFSALSIWITWFPLVRVSVVYSCWCFNEKKDPGYQQPLSWPGKLTHLPWTEWQPFRQTTTSNVSSWMKMI